MYCSIQGQVRRALRGQVTEETDGRVRRGTVDRRDRWEGPEGDY